MIDHSLLCSQEFFFLNLCLLVTSTLSTRGNQETGTSIAIRPFLAQVSWLGSFLCMLIIAIQGQRVLQHNQNSIH
jgi:hypothetical protein